MVIFSDFFELSIDSIALVCISNDDSLFWPLEKVSE